ncbi:type IV pilus biogenesis/stability protein PilW [Oleiagrimonas sp. C23AA]|uniref:type IV pilus biogenesis/stability protein PilW n=1 Tax=Oleiagrimonas sp. C23AA TaxID=2719047 RepID=UPI001420AD13|nr:type IV pilus biogenesis/stability protein PilW [Oleiagrimonas sp. C23AA]NII10939.1 type IV pilus biogenesis/stability protein PilW [Oleiagrimonas sp. C23AA]
MLPKRLLVVVSLLMLLAGCATTGSGGDGLKSKDSNAENAARIHTELGQQYLQRGELKVALEKLKMALQFDDDYVPAHTVIAVLYARIGENAKAEQHYRRANQLEPKSGATNNNLGVFLCREGKVAESLPYFKQALADPFYQTPDAAWSNAGICERKLPDAVTAEKDFRKALSLNPHNADALYNLADMLLAQGKPFPASAFLQRFDALGRPTPASLALGYRIETRLGNAEDAQSYARRLKSKFPDSPQAQNLATTSSQ